MDDQGIAGSKQPRDAAAVLKIASSIRIEVRNGRLFNCALTANDADCLALMDGLSTALAEIVRKMRGA